MKNGFTLIEILVVISVISLLASVVLYSTSEAKLKGNDAKMVVEAKEIEKAIILYKDDNGGKVPTGLNSVYKNNSLGVMVREDTPEFQDVMEELVANDYIPAIPQSPDGESYSYLASADEESAVFAAALNYPSTGSSSNSCDSIQEIPKVWGSCNRATTESSSSADYSWIDYNSSSEALITVNSSAVYANCECNYTVYNTTSKNPDSFPDQLCNNHYYLGRGSCVLSAQPFLFGTYVCPFTGGNAVCSGSDDNDYCSCI
jgi:general secretion pathway protein G